MNPYEVLGISENADEETIKKAYKQLVKKYHPDKYVNNPLADLAAEKMKEINKAYDILTKKSGGYQNQGNTSGGYGRGTGYGNAGAYGGYQSVKPTFELVRTLLNMNQPMKAKAVLEQLPKTAEWYYLSGLASVQMGWYTQGIQMIEQAVGMDPSNSEYRDTLNNIRNRSQSYQNGGGFFDSSIGCCPLPCWCIPCICPCDCC